MTAQHKDDQAKLNARMNDLKREKIEERKQLLAEQAALQEQFDTKMHLLQYNMDLKDKEYAHKMNEMMKIVEKKNYESHYPIPDYLKTHVKENPKSFNIQILGCRGAGKSTFVNKFMNRAGIFDRVAATGSNETTKETAFYEITNKIDEVPDRYGKIFICDQPGIGGLKTTEASYLNNFGPGEINYVIIWHLN